MKKKRVVAYAEWIIRWRWLVIFLSLVSVAAMITGFSKMDFKSDYRIFFSKENPQLLAFEDMQDTYSKSDNVLFVITPKKGDVFTPETLETLQWLTEEAWQTPLSTRVDSITNFQYTYADGDELIVEDLVQQPTALSQEDLQRIGDIAISEPLLVNRLIAEDKGTTAVNVTVEVPDDPQTAEEKQAVMVIANFARELAQKVEQRNPNLEVRLTGMVMMNVSFPEATIKDLSTLLPIMAFVVVPVFMWFMVRTTSGVITSVLLNLFSILGAWGLFFYLGGYLSGPAMSTPIVILTMGVADAVHILVIQSIFAIYY